MSNWTHITACIYLETDIEDNNIEEIIREILQKAPLITGSEGNVDIFVNVLSGHNSYTSCDCFHCPFGHTMRKEKNGSSCLAPQEYECKEGIFQTSVAITIIGDLRDRVKSQTKAEYDNFIKWLKQRFSIRLKTCNIREDL